ncbi:tRNA (adenosine(37)-N6)-threonylcarbamoyltransferase complex dimerization subunit type 1 TsaB [Congregibacter brevis]|uniref:tRNA threonylcarbamoyladenosine biosynthesis protein TsaB n=1 Tax=Congregibacter brevis TaxID=3081201 RepID=A0ABZ0IAI5_9GAMM|nr:tRNA (adenosine(37)-N6)-threonylcarbamoyltransferase complex dimerization subunit type 1 TsaB [Congregibacter sp. IMCC45268]
MSRLLAIDSATDALSLALGGELACRSLHRVMPRQHQQLLFTLLDELFEGQNPAKLDLDAIVYGRGPGSFTGLRIAVSAAQGLAFSLGVPVVGVSSLETQVRTFLRRTDSAPAAMILSCIDARIGQVYGQWFSINDEEVCASGEAFVAPPEALELPDNWPRAEVSLVGVGSGFALQDDMPPEIRDSLTAWPDVLPEAQDMFKPAKLALEAGLGQDPMLATPDYVQSRIGWKTLAEQGRIA